MIYQFILARSPAFYTCIVFFAVEVFFAVVVLAVLILAVDVFWVVAGLFVAAMGASLLQNYAYILCVIRSIHGTTPVFRGIQV